MGSLLDYRPLALCGVYSSFGLTILAQARHRPGAGALGALAFMSAILYWCTLDAHIHGKTFQHGWAIAFAATWPVSLPFYLVWTRGWRGLWDYAVAMGLCAVTGAAAALLGAALGWGGCGPGHVTPWPNRERNWNATLPRPWRTHSTFRPPRCERTSTA